MTLALGQKEPAELPWKKSLPGLFSACWVFKGTILMFGNTLFPVWHELIDSALKEKQSLVKPFPPGSTTTHVIEFNQSRRANTRIMPEQELNVTWQKKVGLDFWEVEALALLSSSGQNAPWGFRHKVVNDAQTTQGRQSRSWAENSRKFEKQLFKVVFWSSLSVRNPSRSDKLAKMYHNLASVCIMFRSS